MENAPEQGELELKKKSKKRVGEFGALLVESESPAEPAEKSRTKHAERLHRQGHAPERLGHMMVVAGAEQAGAETKKATNPEAIRQLPDKRIETMSRAELLSLSAKIIIDGSSLRQIFESHLIGERGLRRLVAEHFRGGDLKKALRQEIIEREIDFERDPGVRDMNPTVPIGGAATGKSSQSPATLTKLLEKANLAVVETNEEAAFYKARAAYEVDQQEQQKQQRRVVDVVFVSVITLLLIVVGVLYLSRR